MDKTLTLPEYHKLTKEQLKLFKCQANNQMTAFEIEQGVSLIKSLLYNPFVCMVGTWAIVEHCQRQYGWGEVTGTMLQSATIMTSALNALSHTGALNELLTAGSKNLETVGGLTKDVLPLLMLSGGIK